MKLVVYSDPGHAWVKVNRKLLAQLNLLDSISTYSYQRKDSVYLEEDCDAPKLYKALREVGKDFTFDERHTNQESRIRNYEFFTNA